MKISDALKSRNFLLLNAVSVGGSVIGMGLGYLYHIISARALSLADYGVLGVIVGVWSILTIPIASVTSVFSREMAKYEGDGKRMNFLASKYGRKVAIYSSLAAIACAIAAFLLGQPLLSLALLGVPFLYTLSAAQSYLQAQERIAELTALTTGIQLLKVLALVLLLALGFGLAGAVGALVASAALVFAAAAAYILPKIREKAPVQVSLKPALAVLVITNALMTLLVYMDLFSVKAFLTDELAGIYNASEITAKILLFLSWAIGIVMYPKVAKLAKEKLSTDGVKLLLSSCAMLIPVFIGFQLLASPFILLFYGEKFAASIPPFLQLSIAMLFMGAAYLITAFLWARRCEMPVLGVHAAAIVFNGALLYSTVPSGGLAAAANATTVTGVLLFAALAALAWREIKRKN